MRRSRNVTAMSPESPGQMAKIVRSPRQPAKAAVLRAFVELIGQINYEDITVGEIIQRAGVSRSSFYLYFTGKHDLLARSVAAPFKILADCVLPTAQPRLTPLLEHFWSNRRSARGVFLGPVRQRAAAVLVREIEDNLERLRVSARIRCRLPSRLLAWQLAESMLGLITAWLTGEARCAAAEVALGLLTAVQAVVTAQLDPL